MTSPDHISAALHARLQKQMNRVAAATVPIYVNANPTEHIGSGVLIGLGDLRFLFTAAHVTDHRGRGDLYLGGAATPIHISGNITETKPPDDGRDRDKIDAAVVHLSDQTAALIGEDEFLSIDELDAAFRHDDFFLVAGYPCSKQRLPRVGDTIEAYLYPFVAVSNLETDYPEPLRTSDQILLGFDKREMWRADLGRVTAPDPYGLSGCGIWWLEGYTADEPSPPRLAGIVTEWHQRETRILGTRITVLLSAVWRDFPQLRELLP